MDFAIVIAHPGYCFAVHMGGYIGGVLDRIEVGNKRYRDPIVVIDSLVTGNDYAHFAGLAAAQLYGSFGADALKINGVVPSGIDETEKAVRLLQQQSCLGVTLRGEKGENRQCYKSQYSYALFAHRKHWSSGEIQNVSSSVCRKIL